MDPATSSSGRLRPGHVFDGDYELLETLGRGGAGVVYRARDRTGREVAIKTLIAAGGLTQTQEERFRREGEIAAKLEHPGIVRVHGSGLTPSGPYLVYELVEGCRSLAEVTEELDVAGRVRLVRDAAEALGYAHAHGVVHRDVKPDNLLVDADGRVRVTDFGAALGEGQERLTRTGGMVGTPFYMSPEQLSSERKELGPPVDVWGLGVVLYEALTGEQPFPAEHLGQLYAMIQKATPEPLRRLNGELPRALEEVCLKALSRDPEERYPDGAALAAALDVALSAAPRVGKGKLLMGVGAAVIALGAVMVLQPWSDEAPAAHGDPSGPAPVASAQPVAAAGGAEEAYRSLSALERPLEQLRAASSWLERYPDHALAEKVAQLQDRIARSDPVVVLTGEAHQVQFVEGDGIAVAFRDRVAVYDLSSRALRGQVQVTALPETMLVTNADDRRRLAYGRYSVTVWLGEAPWTEWRKISLPVAGMRLALSPDGETLAVGTATGIRIYDFSSLTLLRELQPAESCSALSIGPRGRVMGSWEVSRPKRGMRTWSAEGVVLDNVRLSGKASHSLVSSDGRTLFLANPDGVVLKYTAGGDAWVYEGHLVHNDGQAEFLESLAHNRRPSGLAFLGDGRLLSSTGGLPRPGSGLESHNQLRVWDVETRAHLGTFLTRAPRITGLDVSPDGTLFALALPEEGVCEVWSTGLLASD